MPRPTTLPPRPPPPQPRRHANRDAEPMRAARGLTLGIVVSLPVWTVVGVVVWAVS